MLKINKIGDCTKLDMSKIEKKITLQPNRLELD